MRLVKVMELHHLKVAIVGQYPKENMLKNQVFTGIMRVIYSLVQELRSYSDIEVGILAAA